MAEVKVFRNNKGQVAGWWKFGTYFKEVESSRHKMRLYDAYAISEEIVRQLDFLETKKIRLKERDTGRIYEADFDTLLRQGFVKNWDGRQRFLPLKHWKLEEPTLKLFK